jgi:hypothetical protein
MRGDSTSLHAARMAGSSARRKRNRLPHCNAALQQEGADLVDDAGALADQSLAHAVQRLQIELLGGLGCDELHRRTLHSLGDASASRKSFFCPFEYGRTYFVGINRGRAAQLAAEMMRADAGLHADQARRQIGEPCCHLSARPLLLQHDCAALVVAHDVERVLTSRQ